MSLHPEMFYRIGGGTYQARRIGQEPLGSVLHPFSLFLVDLSRNISELKSWIVSHFSTAGAATKTT